MYILTELERKKIVNSILPTAREVNISTDLRGWNWHKAPLKPYYDDTKIPMYLVCSKYCPVNRDVFVNGVLKKKGEINYNVSLGLGTHATVNTVIRNFLDEKTTRF